MTQQQRAPSTTALAGSAGGGLPVPAEPKRSATITIMDQHGDQITVSTWNVCHGVSGFVAGFLGEPGARAEVSRG